MQRFQSLSLSVITMARPPNVKQNCGNNSDNARSVRKR